MMSAVRSILDRYSSATIILGSLIILYIVALALSVVGEITNTPLSMLLSLLVLGVSVGLTSVFMGRALNVAIVLRSQLATAFVLFFIFTPTTDWNGLVALCVAGIIAAASSFIFVFKGYRVFNAAAVSVFTIGLTGIALVSWWVGTAFLFVPVVVLGYAVLKKTQAVLLSSLFLGITSVLIIVVLILQGSTFAQSVVLWFSWPVLFVSFFMLSELIILLDGRRKWQKFVILTVTAILFAAPLTIGNLTVTYTLALLIGELLAFVFTNPLKMRVSRLAGKSHK
jgi:hypothetical protein